MAWGGQKMGLFGQKINPSLFCEDGTPLTKICPKIANRRKLLARSSRGNPPSLLFCPKKSPSVVF